MTSSPSDRGDDGPVRPSNAPTRPAGATDDRDSSRVADALTVVDAPVVVVATLAVVVTVLFDLVAGTARLVVVAPLLFFAPGYALTTALFPRRRTLDGVDALRRPVTAIGARGLGWVERVAVSFATSLALLPPLAVLLSLLDAPLAVGPLVGALASLTVVSAGVGVVRRLGLPPDRRFTVPLDRWATELHDGVVDAPTQLDAALNVVLVVAVVVAVTGLAYGVATPPREEHYTEAALLTREGDSLVAGDYTASVVSGGPVSTVVTVENREGQRQRYALAVAVERVRPSDGETAVLERQVLARERLAVDDGRTETLEPTVNPTLLGEDLRLSYYLYEGEMPESPSAATADEHLFVWIDVTTDGADEAATNAVGTTPGGAA